MCGVRCSHCRACLARDTGRPGAHPSNTSIPTMIAPGWPGAICRGSRRLSWHPSGRRAASASAGGMLPRGSSRRRWPSRRASSRLRADLRFGGGGLRRLKAAPGDPACGLIRPQRARSWRARRRGRGLSAARARCAALAGGAARQGDRRAGRPIGPAPWTAPPIVDEPDRRRRRAVELRPGGPGRRPPRAARFPHRPLALAGREGLHHPPRPHDPSPQEPRSSPNPPRFIRSATGRSCVSTHFTATKRMDGRDAASTIASASARSFFRRVQVGLHAGRWGRSDLVTLRPRDQAPVMGRREASIATTQVGCSASSARGRGRVPRECPRPVRPVANGQAARQTLPLG